MVNKCDEILSDFAEARKSVECATRDGVVAVVLEQQVFSVVCSLVSKFLRIKSKGSDPSEQVLHENAVGVNHHRDIIDQLSR